MGSTWKSLHPYFDTQLSLSPLALHAIDPAFSSKQVPFTILMPKNGSVEDASWGDGKDTSTLSLLVYDDLPQKGDAVYPGGLAQGGEGLQYAIRYILGFSFRDNNTGALRRAIPMRHPRWTWQRAVAITSCKQLAYGTKMPAGFGKGPVPTGKVWVVVVKFSTPVYEVKGDDDVSKEWERYVTREFKPHIEIMTRERGQWKWGPDAPAPLVNQDVTTVGGGLRVAHKRLCLTWWLVPDAYLFMGGSNNTSGAPAGTPVNLDIAHGCVNAFDFLGFAPETVLFVDYETDPVVLPVNPADIYMAGAGKLWGIPRAWNCRLWFDIFSPPTADPVGGHNLAPLPASRKWSRILDKDTGQPPYSGVNFDIIFDPA